MRRFVKDLGVNDQTRILDIGGTPFNWELLDVRPRITIVNMPRAREAIRDAEKKLGKNGRVLVRWSGTEPKLRVMIEGKDQHEIRGWAQEIVDVVKEHLG